MARRTLASTASLARVGERQEGPRKAGGGRAPLAAQGNAACRGRAPRWRVLGCGLGETRLSQSCALRGPPLGIPAAARFSSRERLAHPGHIDFLITDDRFIGSKQIAYFGNVSIVGLMVGALPREGAQGRGLWERGECKGPAPPEPRVCAHRTARHGSPCHEYPCTDLPRRPCFPGGSAPSGGRAGRTCSAPILYTLSRPGKFAQVSDSFVKFPLRPRSDPESSPGHPLGWRPFSG